MSKSYFLSIWLNFHFTVKTFAKLLDYAADSKTSVDGLRIRYKDVDGANREVGFSIDATTMDEETGIFYIIPSWTDSETGQHLNQKIEVERQESHLVAGAHVYYFLCPVTHRRCKKLYLIGDGFRCSKAFRHYYPQQHKSHRDRIRVYDDDAPYRAKGKMYYRGELTPYGKRVQRWEEKEEQDFRELLYECRQILGMELSKSKRR